MRKEYTQQDYTSGRAQISANYTQSVLPGNKSSHYIKRGSKIMSMILKKIYLVLKYILTSDYQFHDLHLHLNFSHLYNASF